ncbi:MAG: hypothetical protein QOE99_2099 [Actinomycetota bacterium]|jgi:hypothetical protein|nr:hypothetical protein [Actinomycetota bacterium]
MSVRLAVEKRSAPVLVVLSRQPRLAVPLASLLLLIGGFALPPALGVACLAVLLVFLAWLTYLSWPVLVGQARAVRAATITLVVVAGVTRLV